MLTRSTFLRSLGAGCALALSSAALAGCSGNTAATGSNTNASGSATGSASGGERTTLTVGMELAYPPFETKDDAGNPAGISPDFMRAFADEHGWDLTIENISFDGLIPSLQTGKVDAVMSSITITPEREEAVDFTEAYANAQLAILTNANSGVDSWDTLNQEGKTVAVKTGSTGDSYATEHLTRAQVLRLADESACVTEVTQGRADGFIYDQLTIYRNQQANPDTTVAVYIPDQEVEQWGIAVQQGDDELREAFNDFIERYRAEGGFDELTEKYLSEEKAAFDELGFRWFFDLDA